VLARLRGLPPDVGLFATWLLVVVTTTTVSLASLDVPLDPAYDHLRTLPLWVQSLVRWDSNHYLTIARDGYTTTFLPAFYPLYPFALRPLNALGIPYAYAGLLVSWAAALVAVVHLRRLAQDHFGDALLARRSVTLFLFAPAGFFLATVYTEALFCALAFVAFHHARRGHWFRACLALGFLTATRLPAVVVCLAVLVEHLSQRGYDLRRLDRSVLWFLLAPLGLVAYVGYCAVVLGDPLAFLHAYDDAWTYQRFDPNVVATVVDSVVDLWHRASAPGGPHVAALFRNGLGTVAWLFCCAVTLASVRRQPASYTVLALGTLVFISLNSNLQAVNRYVLVLFPVVFALVGARRLRSEQRFTLVLLVSAAVMLLSAGLFAHARWVG
jgi:hypothetical protein